MLHTTISNYRVYELTQTVQSKKAYVPLYALKRTGGISCNDIPCLTMNVDLNVITQNAELIRKP